MRRSRAGPSAHLARVHMHRAVILTIGHDDGGPIDIAELDVEVRDERLRARHAEMRSSSHDVTRVGLLSRERPDGPALGLVAIEEPRAGTTGEDVGELP